MEAPKTTTQEEQQADPNRYRYLMVPVFGLSAQFVNLSPACQESVIERVVLRHAAKDEIKTVHR
jgi:pyruvate-formate lyase